MARQIVGLGKTSQPPQITVGRPSLIGRNGSGVLRSRRSVDYLTSMRQLDGGQLHGRADLQPVFDAIAAEFTPSGSTIPKGIVSRCYLGAPFEVHELDLFQEIVEHYEGSQLMPQPGESYRALALHPDYSLVEIYDDRVLCIRFDGDAVQIER